jgi:hypothetical protein
MSIINPPFLDYGDFARGIAQSGSAPALGAGCRGFKSLYPDQVVEVLHYLNVPRREHNVSRAMCP